MTEGKFVKWSQVVSLALLPFVTACFGIGVSAAIKLHDQVETLTIRSVETSKDLQNFKEAILRELDKIAEKGNKR